MERARGLRLVKELLLRLEAVEKRKRKRKRGHFIGDGRSHGRKEIWCGICVAISVPIRLSRGVLCKDVREGTSGISPALACGNSSVWDLCVFLTGKMIGPVQVLFMTDLNKFFLIGLLQVME